MSHECWRRVYLAPSSWGCSSADGHLLLGHHCRDYPEGAIIPQVGHVPQEKVGKGPGGPPVGNLQNVPEAPGMGEGQVGSLRTDLMRSGHYPPQVWARPHIGSWNHLRWPLRHGWSDVLRVAFIPGDEEVAMGRAKSVGLPPINPQGPDGAKGTVFVVRAEDGGTGLDMDDGGRVPCRLVLSKGTREGNGGKQIHLAQMQHLRANCSGHAPDYIFGQEWGFRVRYLREISWIGSYGKRRRAERTRKRSQMEYVWGCLHPWWSRNEPGPDGEGHLTGMNRRVGEE